MDHIKHFKRIRSILNKDVVEIGSYVKLTIGFGSNTATKEGVLSNNNAEGISIYSTLGQAILGKTSGEPFVYELVGNSLCGIIDEVENVDFNKSSQKTLTKRL